MVQSTIDKIKDTTIMRQIRNLAGVVDEQNASVEAVNNKLDSFNLEGVETDIANLKSSVSTLDTTVDQVEISVNENTTHLTTVDSTLDNHAIEINTIKAKDTSQDAEIQGLSESVVSDLTGNFDNTTRKLSLSIERKNATSIDCDVVIPSDGTTGSYTGGAGIEIDSNNVINAKIDNSTIKVNSDGKLYSEGGSGGKTYTAGNGINITDDVISANVGEGLIIQNKKIIVDTATFPTYLYIAANYETKTSAYKTYATKTELNTLKSSVGDAIKPISFTAGSDGITVTMEALGGQTKTDKISLATGSSAGLISPYEKDMLGNTLDPLNKGVSGGYFTRIDEVSLAPSVDGTTIHYNDNKQLEVIGGGSSGVGKFSETDTNYGSASSLFSYINNLPIGTMVTIYFFGRTASSPCGTLTGIIKNKSPNGDTYITYIGGNFYNGSELAVIGAMNYNVQPYFNISKELKIYKLWMPEVKGNAVTGKTYDMGENFQGYSVAIFN